MTTPIQVAYSPLGGGLDVVSSALQIQPGYLTQCLNVECAFGVQGYRRIYGYERLDGHPEPHDAAYAIQAFNAGSIAVNVGDIVTGPADASGEVIQVDLQSGSWANGDAAGFVVLVNPINEWMTGYVIQVGGVTVALAADNTNPANVTTDGHYDYLRLARNTRRAKISAVPGSGPIRGVAIYQGNVYAVRDVADGSTATFWRSSAAGWVAQTNGLAPGGRYRFVVANFTGDTLKIKLYGVNGIGRYFSFDGTTFLYAAPLYGSQGASTTTNTLGTGSKTFTITDTARSWVAGDSLTVRDAANWGFSMTGTVTSYTDPTLVLNVTSFTGAGTGNNWTIGESDYSDVPYEILAHKDHMWFAFPRGQLQTSNLGDPMVSTTTAAVFGLGDEITGLASLKGSVLGVWCRSKLTTISGSSATDWAEDPFTQSAGAIFGTVVETGGNALFLDERGVTSLQGTQNYGSFQPSFFSGNVKPLLKPLIPNVIGARMTRESYQYRLYTGDGQVLSFALMTANASVRPKDVAPTLQQYLHNPTCFFEGNFNYEDDCMVFGTDDGFVMRESVGTSFDGAEIESVLRLPFDHFKSPANNKRFYKIQLEIDSHDAWVIRFMQLFDYEDGRYDPNIQQSADMDPIGALWDVENWNEFFWGTAAVSQVEAQIDGLGRNMAQLLWASSDVFEPYILSGIMVHNSIRGLRR